MVRPAAEIQLLQEDRSGIESEVVFVKANGRSACHEAISFSASPVRSESPVMLVANGMSVYAEASDEATPSTRVEPRPPRDESVSDDEEVSILVHKNIPI